MGQRRIVHALFHFKASNRKVRRIRHRFVDIGGHDYDTYYYLWIELSKRKRRQELPKNFPFANSSVDGIVNKPAGWAGEPSGEWNRFPMYASSWLLEEDLENPNRFRMEMLVDSWSEHLGQHERITRLEREALEKAASYHLGEKPVHTKHFLSVDRDVFLLGQRARNGAGSRR